MITLLIPTLNRSDFVIRYLRYLGDTGFRGRVCIGDSSSSWHVDRTKRAIQELNTGFEVIHREYPGLMHFECVRRMLPLISTPYAMCICDDDLLIPSTLDYCMQFLDTHPDYSGATGVATVFTVRPDGAYGQMASARGYPLRPVEAESASQRLLDLLSDYQVIGYSLARTEQFKARWVVHSDFSDKAFAMGHSLKLG